MKIILHDRGKDDNFKIWHALDENMLLFSHSDGGSIVCGEHSYPIERGAICFVGEGKYHYTMPDPPERYDRSKLFFSAEVLRRTAELVGDGRIFSHFAPCSFVYAKLPDEVLDEAYSLFEAPFLARSDAYREAIEMSSLIRLLVLIDRYSSESTRGEMDTLGRAIEYINSNIFREIDIDEICAAVHISKYHFCRRFKEKMGVTVMEYLLKTRIVLAKNMLEKESLSVTEVSERCGFSSVSYFCRVFKEECGLTPLGYKKQTRHVEDGGF